MSQSLEFLGQHFPLSAARFALSGATNPPIDELADKLQYGAVFVSAYFRKSDRLQIGVMDSIINKNRDEFAAMYGDKKFPVARGISVVHVFLIDDATWTRSEYVRESGFIELLPEEAIFLRNMIPEFHVVPHLRRLGLHAL